MAEIKVGQRYLYVGLGITSRFIGEVTSLPDPGTGCTSIKLVQDLGYCSKFGKDIGHVFKNNDLNLSWWILLPGQDLPSLS
jgi:hypothetical protein